MGARIAFPPFSFDRDERVLRRDGRTVPLAPKVAEALGLLLADPGALVEKNALRDALWPEGFVEDGNLTQTIYLIRRALDPAGDGRAFVETVPRRGYRFVPAVCAVAPENASASRAWFALRTLARAAAVVLLCGGISAGSSVSAMQPPFRGDAARAYALAQYNWNLRSEAGIRAAIADFSQVVQFAPDDARGYAGLSEAYVTVADWGYTRIAPPTRAFSQAEWYARQALRRDPRSGEAFTTLGWIAMKRDSDLDRSERLFKAALALRPDHAPAYENYGIVRLYRADVSGGVAALRRSVELDPLSPIDLLWYGRSLRYAHRYADARAAFRQVLELQNPFKEAGFELALVESELGNYDAAKATLRRYRSRAESPDYAALFDALIDLRSGRTPKSVPDLRPRARANLDSLVAAELCLAMGRRDDALEWLRLSLAKPHERIARKSLAIEPLLAPLHDDPRFRALTT